MRSQALEDLFVQELSEIYEAEKQIYKGLSVMAKSAHNAELKSAFQTHQKQTKTQIDRVEKAFRILGEKPSKVNTAGVSGLIRQSKDLAADNAYDPAVADAALIASGQKIEHYEIAAYGCLRTHASILGYKELESLLEASLNEEEQADALLTEIAKGAVNISAAAAPYSQARTGTRHDLERLLAERPSSSGKLSLAQIALGLAIGGALSILISQKAQS